MARKLDEARPYLPYKQVCASVFCVVLNIKEKREVTDKIGWKVKVRSRGNSRYEWNGKVLHSKIGELDQQKWQSLLVEVSSEYIPPTRDSQEKQSENDDAPETSSNEDPELVTVTIINPDPNEPPEDINTEVIIDFD